MSTVHPSQQTSPSEAVIYRVAEQQDVDPVELPPLYESIDPDALDSLVQSSAASDSQLEVEFTYAGHDVTVTGSGTVLLEEAIAPQTTV